ncbi:phage tail protein [Metapseudomonas furukawaii]|uniref:phage tail protein n=1 Tax=Metapseudomonas furukawaii TaxID=1149133 RepID=UPI00227C0FC1|nr:phage tail protein [Pseudomonas furukawaii]WAG76971.1 phage tail protein [Pseudomonas furukawaii]
MSTGQGVGGLVGAIAGAILAAPTGGLSVWGGAAIGLQAGMAVGGYLDPPKGPTVDGPRLSDKAIQTSTYGTMLPRFYGTIGVSGNITWLENNQLKETVRKKKQGGKGGGSTTTTKIYTYSATFFLSLGLGPIAGVRRIWCSDKLIYNAGSDDLETIIASNQAATGFKVYLGTDDQLPDPRYEADVGVGNASAYRGEAYLAFYDFQLADFGNTLQGAQFKVEVVAAGTYTTPRLNQALSYVGTPCYGDADGFQTFEALPGFITGGSTGVYTAQVIFRNYTLSGHLIREYTLSHDIRAADTANLTFYKSLVARGKKDGLFAYRGSGTPSVSFPGMPLDEEVAVNLGSPSSDSQQTYAGGYYWLTGGNTAYRVDESSAVTYTLPDTIASDAQSYVVEQDTASGAFYARWLVSSTNETRIGEIDPDALSIAWWSSLGTGLDIGITTQGFFYVHAGRVAVKNQSLVKVYRIDDSSLTLIGSTASAGGVANSYTFADGFALTGTHVYQISDSLSLDPVPLADVIESEIALSSLLTGSDIDTSLLAAEVRGYRVSGGSIRSALEPLQGAYPFDIIQSGYQLKCVPRGQASSVTIPWEDLGAADGDTPGDLLQESREMDSQLPALVAVKYLDAAREYAVGEQSKARINTQAINRVDREVSLVLTADEAAAMADVLVNLPWLERTPAKFTLPPPYLDLEPADVVTVVTPSATHEFRLTDANYTPDGRLECEAKPNRAALYTSTAKGGEGVPPTGTIPLAGPTLLVLLDLPVVDETVQNDPGFGAVAVGYTPGWPGGVAFRSIDAGQTWTEVQGFTGLPTLGYARGTLPASSGAVIDQRSLVVDLLAGELESVTRDQMIAGQNYAAYGADGRWEIIRVQNATLQADGSYLLSGFVRGDRGTEWATGLHQAGDLFVLLDDPDNFFIDMAVGSIGVPATYRGVTSGATIDSASDVPFTYQGVNLECLSPASANGVRDASGNFSATFVRRSRLSSSWWTTGVPAPIGETTEAYDIEVMDGSAVVRTLTATSPEFDYPAADQVADFGSAQSSITFRIYQRSEVVGRGYPLEVTL